MSVTKPVSDIVTYRNEKVLKVVRCVTPGKDPMTASLQVINRKQIEEEKEDIKKT
mgnify:CR=1 FL=1